MNCKIVVYISLILSIIACSSKKNSSPEPNIILISADDLGWSDIGCYGSEVETPHLDKLAHEGMRFTRFHNTSKCFPSRACLITGVYAHDCGYNETFTDPIMNAVTIGEVLQGAGYLTYWSGKHHGKENPYTRGFDHYYGLKDGCCNYFNPGYQRENEGKPAQKRIRHWCIDSTCYKPFTPENNDFYTTDYFTKYAIDFINEANEKEKPFFLYLAYNAPHDPLMAWPGDIKKYKGKYNIGYEKIREERYNRQLKSGLIDSTYSLSKPSFTPWDSLTAPEQEYEAQKMEVYAAMIDRMDQNIGKILNELNRLDLMDNSVIFFVSDNGASAEVVRLKNDNDSAAVGSLERWTSLGGDWANVSNTPYRFYKNYSYEGGINTPLIAWWPQKIKPNTVSSSAGHFIDIMPTIVDIAGAKYPKSYNGANITPMRGISLMPALQGKDLQREEPLYWQWRSGKALLYDNWKIVKHGEKSEWDLYNIVEDPTETNNLNTQFPQKIKELDSLFTKWFSRYN